MQLRRIVFTGLLCWALPLMAAGDAASRLRALGAELAHARSKMESGIALSQQDLNRYQQALDDVVDSVGNDETSTKKLWALGRELALIRQFGSTTSPRAVAARPARSQLALEVLAPTHGSSCDNALGLTLNGPVRLGLATGADAWFYVPVRSMQALHVATRSDGPDPSLSVYAKCAQNLPLATNDDALGLDADVIVATDGIDAAFVHVINNGASGSIDVNAVTAVGTITGTVRDVITAQPINSAYVEAFTSTTNGGYVPGVYTDYNGSYTLAPTEAGSYYVAAEASYHIARVYPSGNCKYSIYGYGNLDYTDCDVSHATTVTVSETTSVSGINFALGAGVQISGQVRATDNDPIPGATVTLSGASDAQLTRIGTDTAGHYTIANLPPDTYFAQAGDIGFVSQLWNHINCVAQPYQLCTTASATPITVGTVDVTGINFSLQKSSTITGIIADAHGPISIPYSQVSVTLIDQSGNVVGAADADGSGRYTISPVPVGTYYLYTTVTGYFGQLYSGDDRMAQCTDQLAGATPIQVAVNEQQIEADFTLTPLPTVSGRVTDAVTGAPLANIAVVVTESPNTYSYPSTAVTTDASGNFLISNVGPGTYYVWAQSPDHVDQIYSGVSCEYLDNYYANLHCDLSTATLLNISYAVATPSRMDFALQPSASISGRVIERAGTASDLPATGVSVNIYDATGTLVAYGVNDATGAYKVPDLAPGTYYALATSSFYFPRFISQQWQNTNCASCVPTTGTPIHLMPGTAASDIDFQLTSLDSIVGRVVDESGQPIRGAVVDLFDSTSKTYVTGAASDAAGYYAVEGTINSSYYVATEAGGGYVDQVYSGISCPFGSVYDEHCSLNGASTVNLSGTATQPHVINFVLTVGDRVFRNGFE